MRNLTILVFLIFLAGCTNFKWKQEEEIPRQEVISLDSEQADLMEEYEKGTYGYDAGFLKKYAEPVELKNGDSRLTLSLKYQGRVMTSTSNGLGGKSYGWINHDLIESGKVLEQFNPVGGEERFWLGPEGGQFSLFFEPKSSFKLENWNTPACLDTEPFDVFLATDSIAVFLKSMQVKNYSDFQFDFKLTRRVELMGKGQIETKLGITLPGNVKTVGYESINELQNIGQEAWKKETGLLSVWLLGMFPSSPSLTMIFPYKTNVKSDYIVKDDYFGKIPDDRLVVDDGMIYFKGDGQERGKIGIPPRRAEPVFGSYDSENNVLTLVKCDIPDDQADYVNSAWEEHQKNPYEGDVINAYNDGPSESGEQWGAYYELDSSSPALALDPNESAEYKQSIFHFEGKEEELDAVCRQVFNVPLNEIKSVFGARPSL